MLNLVGTSYDYGSVTFAVLQECEHRRKSLLDAEAPALLQAIARRKMSELEAGFKEGGGDPLYWQGLQSEMLENVMPRYIPSAIEQTRLERSHFDVWRTGDLVARSAISLAMLMLGGLIIWLPFIPIFEDAFAFFLALAGWFYPELKRLLFEYRHSRFLNAVVAAGTKYQKLLDKEYLASPHLAEALQSYGRLELPPIETTDETKQP